MRWRKRLERQTEQYETSASLFIPEVSADWRLRIDSARHQVDEHLSQWSQNLRDYRRACRNGEVTQALLHSLREARRAWKRAWKEFLALEQAMPLPA